MDAFVRGVQGGFRMSEQKYVLELTKSQARNLADFIAYKFIDSIREDKDIENIWYG